MVPWKDGTEKGMVQRGLLAELRIKPPSHCNLEDAIHPPTVLAHVSRPAFMSSLKFKRLHRHQGSALLLS